MTDEMTETEAAITLGILDGVNDDAAVSQRSLSRELGIALGLTNAYLRRCVNKGLIKVRKIPPNRYAYYLTPKGFTEKSHLTARYFKRSFDLYRHARRDLENCFRQISEKFGPCRIVLCGGGELAEIATLVATQHDVTLVAIVDNKARQKSFVSLPVIRSLAEADGFDAVIVTDFERPNKLYGGLVEDVDDARIFTPALLKIARKTEGGTDA